MSKPVSFRSVALFVVLSVAGFFVVGLLDESVFHFFANRLVRESDVIRMFRATGFLGTWLIAAAALMLVDGTWRRGATLLAAPVLTGITGEILKLLIRRNRPGDFPVYIITCRGRNSGGAQRT